MQGFAALAVLSGAYVVLAWSHVAQPLIKDNPKGYHACVKLHPQRYCMITHLPSKVEVMERN
jgi:hypothetical protein